MDLGSSCTVMNKETRMYTILFNTASDLDIVLDLVHKYNNAFPDEPLVKPDYKVCDKTARSNFAVVYSGGGSNVQSYMKRVKVYKMNMKSGYKSYFDGLGGYLVSSIAECEVDPLKVKRAMFYEEIPPVCRFLTRKLLDGIHKAPMERALKKVLRPLPQDMENIIRGYV